MENVFSKEGNPISTVEEVLSILNPDNNVLELRILKTKNGTVSGYFNDMKELAKNADIFNGHNNVFITLNPCNTDLLARANNNIQFYAKDTTNDNEIIKRIWLPIDFDPERPSGISSTNEEHTLAIEMAKYVQEELSEAGFPEGILADSGNGAHLLYRIDLENTTENKELLKSFLKALDSLYSDQKVKIDTTVYNAARIWKLYGTMAVKGENLKERPHRQAQILSPRKELKPVDIEIIKQISDMVDSKDNKKVKSTNSSPSKMFDVEEFIKKHGILVNYTQPYKGGTLWNIQCPMNEEHAKDARIIQLPNGAIEAGCFHNSCQGWGWKELREKFEPDYNKKSNQSKNILPPPPHLAKYHELLQPRFGIDENGMLYKISKKNGGEYFKNLLCNFIAIPTEKISSDDGYGQTQYLKICGYIGEKELPSIEVKIAEFPTMHWTLEWSLEPTIFAGNGNRDFVREATQCLSKNIKNTTIFKHIGWKKIEDKWCYLHAGGSIGKENVEVNLTEEGLDNYILENPATLSKEAKKEAIRKSMELLDLFSNSFVLISESFLAPLCEPLRIAGYEPGFSVWIEGRSGSHKSTIAALFLNFFGKNFSVTNLPASFKDTKNALERLTAICKDSLIVIDDYRHSTNKRENGNMDSIASSLLWNFSNKDGRRRMTSETKLRKSYKSKGMGIFTGEDNPSVLGESTVARYLSIELKRNEIGLDKLSACQKNTTYFNQTMASYIEWLAERMDILPEELKLYFEEFRNEAMENFKAHPRFHSTFSWIKIGLTYFLKFALDMEVITEQEKENIIESCCNKLLEIASNQIESAEDEKISTKYITALSVLMSSGKVKTTSLISSLDDEDTDPPTNYKAEMIGWHDNEYYYIMPTITMGEVRQFYSRQGYDFSISAKSLYKELESSGFIKRSKDKPNPGSKTIFGGSKKVLTISRKIIDNFTTDTESGN